MGLKTIEMLVGQLDINKQFDEGSLRQNLNHFENLYQNGDYEFGTLTAAFFDLKKYPHEYATWIEDTQNYPEPAKRAIKNVVIVSVTNKDKHGNPHPVPINWSWTTDPNDPNKQEVIVTLNESPLSYSINLVGYPSPPKSLLAQRREKREKK